MKDKLNNISLATLKRAVADLEKSLEDANKCPDDLDYMMELSKASGVAATLMGEAYYLVNDIQHQISKIQTHAPSSQGKNDLLTKLMGGPPFKGGGSN